MKRIVMVLMIAACQMASAEDDLLNCKWENGELMSESACESQRYLQSDRERIRIEETVRQKEEEKTAKKRKECAGMSRKVLNNKERNAIAKAVKDALKDPDSAKFKWMKLSGKGANREGYVGYYCGLVNARNSYGGYTGYTPFAAMIGGFGTPKFEVIFVTLADNESDDVLENCAKECYTDFRLAN